MRDARSIAAIVMALSLTTLLVSSVPASAGDTAGSINFDNVDAPCNFVDTSALRDEYAGLGVHFRGKGPLNGGGILNECGNFGVTGYSPPNFLAFNPGALYGDGGIPNTPQYIYFDNTVRGVRLKAGGPSGGTLRMTAYDVNRQVIGTKTLVMTPDLQTLTVVGQGIKGVAIKAQLDPGAFFVIDDLEWR